METFGKIVQVTNAVRINNICYKHRVNINMFITNVLTYSIFLCFLFVVVNIYNVFLEGVL